MIPFLKPQDVSAKLVKRGRDDTLVISLASGVTPVLTQVNLVKNPDLSFQVIEQDSFSVLGIATASRPFQPIAQFLAREEADAALLALRKPMMSSCASHSGFPIKLRWVFLVFVLAFIVYEVAGDGGRAKLTSIGDTLAPASEKTGRSHASDSLEARRPDVVRKIHDGEPVTADDFLKMPSDEPK